MAGAIVYLPDRAHCRLMFFAFFRMYKSYTPMLADLLAASVLGAITGGVIGQVLGMMKKE